VSIQDTNVCLTLGIVILTQTEQYHFKWTLNLKIFTLWFMCILHVCGHIWNFHELAKKSRNSDEKQTNNTYKCRFPLVRLIFACFAHSSKHNIAQYPAYAIANSFITQLHFKGRMILTTSSSVLL